MTVKTLQLLGISGWVETPEEELLERAERALEAFAERCARDRDVREFAREEQKPASPPGWEGFKAVSEAYDPQKVLDKWVADFTGAAV